MVFLLNSLGVRGFCRKSWLKYIWQRINRAKTFWRICLQNQSIGRLWVYFGCDGWCEWRLFLIKIQIYLGLIRTIQGEHIRPEKQPANRPFALLLIVMASFCCSCWRRADLEPLDICLGKLKYYLVISFPLARRKHKAHSTRSANS